MLIIFVVVIVVSIHSSSIDSVIIIIILEAGIKVMFVEVHNCCYSAFYKKTCIHTTTFEINICCRIKFDLWL